MRKFLEEHVFNEKYSLRERIFRLIILVGFVLSLVAIVVSAYTENLYETMAPLLCMFFSMLVGMLLTFRYQKLDIAAYIVAVAINGIAFPTMFFLCGAIESGASVWFVLGIFYLFMMFRGKRLALFLGLSIVIDVITYLLAYRYPELVVPMSSRESIYIDSLFAVLATGLAGGFIILFFMYLYDTERAIVIKQNEELEEASNSKNASFARVSHEIRTPINTIVGLNEMILRENPTGTTAEYAQNIKSASKMLLSLVNDFLDLSRIESQRMEIYPAPYKTQNMIAELVDMVRVGVQEKGLELFVEVDENLPSELIGDEKRIKQILINILANAVKYTNEGSVTLSASAEKVDENHVALKMSVADTGIGIRKEDIPHLYKTFSRVDEKSNIHVEGTGLGLSIAKQLLDLMGGEITVDSIYTKGTVFTVEIKQPIVDETPIGNSELTAVVSADDADVYQQLFEAPAARILLVDDNDLNVMVAKKLLEATKVEVDVASSGEECLEKTKQRLYHVILMDYMMPRMNGHETLKRLRTQENGLCRNTAVVLMTANTLEETQRLMKDVRFDGYLEKPIDSKKLEETILRFLPNELVEYRKNMLSQTTKENEIRKISGRKRKTVYITTDCVSDLPADLVEKHDIKVMYLYIKTENGRFADTKEINSDHLAQYITEDGVNAYGDSSSVEEYEAFFADALTQAEQVVHISMAKNTGRSHEVAKTAAAGFDHVQVIDAGHISCGEALIVLYAASLAEEGYKSQEICEMVETMKNRVVSKYIMPSADIFAQRGRTSLAVANICRWFMLRPVIAPVKSKVRVIGFFAGALETAWKGFIRFHLRRKGKINTDIVIVTHSGCSVKEQDFLRNELMRFLPFKRIIMQKASFTNACSVGAKAVGIAYYVNP
ncbi:MAG: DegV family EDD domain-containing protein [Roseburia sp.]|nr:DegV family EDD domain-containing protein [Roseburia sp.]